MGENLRLEDRQLIKNQLYKYCWEIDHNNVDGWLSVFTDDVHFEFGDEVNIDGKENLKSWITEIANTLLNMRHIVTNFVFEFTGEDKAESRCYWSFNSGFAGHESEGVTERAEGKYFFSWKKINGEWLAYHQIAEAVWWTGYNA